MFVFQFQFQFQVRYYNLYFVFEKCNYNERNCSMNESILVAFLFMICEFFVLKQLFKKEWYSFCYLFTNLIDLPLPIRFGDESNGKKYESPTLRSTSMEY